MSVGKNKVRYGLFALCALIISSAFLHAADAEKDSAEKKLQSIYFDYLREEGFFPKLDKDGDINFKYQGGNYCIFVNSKDPAFFRIVYPNFWPIETDKEMAFVLRAADYSNGMSKTSKIYTVNKNVWAAIEIFVERPESFKGIFRRSLSALQNGVGNFVTKMNSLKAEK